MEEFLTQIVEDRQEIWALRVAIARRTEEGVLSGELFPTKDFQDKQMIQVTLAHVAYVEAQMNLWLHQNGDGTQRWFAKPEDKA
jgi:hypothetical protein